MLEENALLLCLYEMRIGCSDSIASNGLQNRDQRLSRTIIETPSTP